MLAKVSVVGINKSTENAIRPPCVPSDYIEGLSGYPMLFVRWLRAPECCQSCENISSGNIYSRLLKVVITPCSALDALRSSYGLGILSVS